MSIAIFESKPYINVRWRFSIKNRNETAFSSHCRGSFNNDAESQTRIPESKIRDRVFIRALDGL